MSEYRNVLVPYNGQRYRVSFHVGLARVVGVFHRRYGEKRERCLTIDGRTAKPIVALAQAEFAAINPPHERG